MNQMNPIKDYMTKAPHTIGEGILLSKAMEMMREYGVRHLPVQSQGKLVGVLSDRDIKLALTVHPTARDLKAGDIMTEDPYSVTADCPLEQVVTEMAKKKFGCAVVADAQGRAIGILTAVDALGVLGERLRKSGSLKPNLT